MTVTAPELTVKLAEANEATPLFEVVANSAAIVNVSPETDESIPSPPYTVNVSPKSTALVVPLSAATEIVEFYNLAFVIEPANLAVAIEPANMAFVIPKALTLNASEETSTELSSTATLIVLPVLVNASPALI